MSVFEFADYKRFLKVHLASLPKKGRGEINRMAQAIRVHPTLVSQVLSGTKDFTPEQIQSVSGYFGFSHLETDYLICLVQVARAGTRELKVYYQAKCDEIKGRSLDVFRRIKEHRSLTDQEQAVFYSSWIYSAIRLFASVGKGQSLDRISQKFGIPRSAAGEILQFLKEAALVKEDDGLFQMGAQHTHLDSKSPFLNRHHSNWRLQALHRSDSLTSEELMFTSPFSVDAQGFKKIREQLIGLIKSTSVVIRDAPAEDIACLNLDLFWVQK